MTYKERYAKANSNIVTFLYEHCGILAEEFNEKPYLGYTEAQIADILKNQTETAELVNKLKEYDEQFGCDAMYYGVCSADEIEISLREEGYLPSVATAAKPEYESVFFDYSDRL